MQSSCAAAATAATGGLHFLILCSEYVRSVAPVVHSVRVRFKN